MLNQLTGAYKWVREQFRAPPGWSKYTTHRHVFRDPMDVGAKHTFGIVESLYFPKGLSSLGRWENVEFVTSVFLAPDNHSTSTSVRGVADRTTSSTSEISALFRNPDFYSSGAGLKGLSDRMTAILLKRDEPKSLEQATEDFWAQHIAARDAVVAEYERQHVRQKAA